jgi:hypothetical protein
MKRIMIFVGILFFAGITSISIAEDKDRSMEHLGHPLKMKTMNDKRISLCLSPAMKQDQLSNMRSHLQAIQSTLGLLAEESFDEASRIAHSKLGLTAVPKK